MQQVSPNRPAIPVQLKIAMGLFLAHVALYAVGIVKVASAGEGVRPNWIFHVVVCLFLTSRVSRQNKRTFYVLVLYTILISAMMLRADYAAAETTNDVSMLWSIVVCSPLLAAGVALTLGRRYYLAPHA